MADQPNTPTRRSILGGAAAVAMAGAVAPAVAAPVQHDRAKWDRRLHRYEVLLALQTANETFGQYWHDKEENLAEDFRIADEYGSRDKARADPEGLKLIQASIKRDGEIWQKHDNAFVTPAENASVILVKTPAPDLAALKRKIEIIQHHDLHLMTIFEGEPMDYVHADAKRLLGG